MVKEVKGNIFSSKADMLLNFVNCSKYLDVGYSGKIKKKYPKVYSDYKLFLEEMGTVGALGKTQFSKQDNGVIVANVFVQFSFGKDRKHIDYALLRSGLEDCRKLASEYNLKVALPYMATCNSTSGGDWEVVKEIIESVFSDNIVCEIWSLTRSD